MSLAEQGPPRVIHGLDVRSLPLSPEEAFVLSRVDGRAAPADIAAATGLSEGRVVECLLHLRELGAIDFGANGPRTPDRTPTQTPTPRPRSSARLRPIVETQAATFTPHPGARSYVLSLLDEPADIDRERKTLILDYFHSLDRLTHYALLHVSETASKAEIKEAYYQRVGLFHPDRYFGKDLGSFKPKLEKVFGALTKAYDTLTRSRSREDYDRYLAASRGTAGLRQSLPPARLTPPPARREPATAAPEPRAVEAASAGPRRASIPPDPEATRRALARKLGGGRPSIPPPPRPPTIDEASMAHAEEEFRARYAKHLEDSEAARVERYRKIAEDALQAERYPSAINALRVALSVVPEDPDLAALLEQTQAQADVAHADQFLEQARYEEKDGRMAKAALSYERAARGKKAANLYDRAASCMLEAGTDARKAVDLARKAVELDPERSQFRLTLARAYHQANLPTSASSEIKRAHELAPDNDEIKTWLKRLK